jgi:hypothetical protein
VAVAGNDHPVVRSQRQRRPNSITVDLEDPCVNELFWVKRAERLAHLMPIGRPTSDKQIKQTAKRASRVRPTALSAAAGGMQRSASNSATHDSSSNPAARNIAPNSVTASPFIAAEYRKARARVSVTTRLGIVKPGRSYGALSDHLDARRITDERRRLRTAARAQVTRNLAGHPRLMLRGPSQR